MGFVTFSCVLVLVPCYFCQDLLAILFRTASSLKCALLVFMALFILGLVGLTVCDTALNDNPVPASPVPVPSAASA